MEKRTAYHSALQAFRVPEAPVLVARTHAKSVLSIAEIIGPPNHGLTASIPQADAYILQLRLLDCPGSEYFIDGAHVPNVDRSAGALQLHDVRSNPTVEARDAFHIMHIHMPIVALRTTVERFTHVAVNQLELAASSTFRDPVIQSMFTALRPSLAKAEEANALFVEHILHAICAHMVSTYGGFRPLPPLPKGGMAPWQERRVREMLDADIAAELTLSQLAAECNISIRHFSRVFVQTFGMPPHSYQLKRRLELACKLLLDARLTLNDIATACGFASLSHMTRLFRANVGTSPGDWRRARMQLR